MKPESPDRSSETQGKGPFRVVLSRIGGKVFDVVHDGLSYWSYDDLRARLAWNHDQTIVTAPEEYEDLKKVLMSSDREKELIIGGWAGYGIPALIITQDLLTDVSGISSISGNSSGAIIAAVAATGRLDELSQLLEKHPLPEGNIFSKRDHILAYLSLFLVQVVDENKEKTLLCDLVRDRFPEFLERITNTDWDIFRPDGISLESIYQIIVDMNISLDKSTLSKLTFSDIRGEPFPGMKLRIHATLPTLRKTGTKNLHGRSIVFGGSMPLVDAAMLSSSLYPRKYRLRWLSPRKIIDGYWSGNDQGGQYFVSSESDTEKILLHTDDLLIQNHFRLPSYQGIDHVISPDFSGSWLNPIWLTDKKVAKLSQIWKNLIGGDNQEEAQK